MNQTITRRAGIWLWLQFFKLNKPYKAYCYAKRNNKKTELVDLDKTYPLAAQLYSDWGDIHQLNTFSDRSEFSTWLRPRKHLFNFRDLQVQHTTNRSKAESLPDRTAFLTIPLYLSKAEAMRQAEVAITRLYKTMPEDRKKPSTLRYYFHKNGRLTKAQMISLYKRLVIHYLDLIKETGKQAKSADSTLKTDIDLVDRLLREDDKHIKWQYTEEDIISFAGGVFGKATLYEKERQVRRYRQEAQIIIEHTIQGLFPITASSLLE